MSKHRSALGPLPDEAFENDGCPDNPPDPSKSYSREYLESQKKWIAETIQKAQEIRAGKATPPRED